MTRQPDDAAPRPGDPQLPPALERAFQSYGVVGPGRAASDAIWEGVRAASVARSARLRRRLLYAAPLVLGLAAGLLWAVTRAPEAPAARPAVHGAAPVEPVGAAPVEPVGAAPVEPVGAAPAIAVRARGPSAERGDPAAELLLLSRAKRALASDCARALALVAEHAQRFPRGVLAEERELIAVEALMRSGDEPAARRRGAAFLRAFPRSAHRERLSVVLREP